MTTYPTTATVQPATNPLNRWLAKVFPLNWETAIYIVILLLAIFTRFYQLGDRTMSHDESLHTKFSWDLYANGVFQHTPLMHGPILFHMTALNYFLFGDNDFTARIYPAVLGVLMVMFPVLFRRWIGRWGAILASIMFLISPLILFYNRYIREDTPSIFFTLVMVYCTFMYLNGPTHLRRKARWLYIFSAAMLGSMATKEVAFMYLAIFFSILLVYWLARMAEYFFHLPGKTLMYFASLSVLVAGIAALAMYVVLEITPLNTALSNGPGTLEFASFFKWTLAIIAATATVIIGPLLWVFRRSISRIPWLEVLLLVLLVGTVALTFIVVEERSRISHLDDASAASTPNVPGQEDAATVTSGYKALPLYAEWAGAIVIIAIVAYSVWAGWWRKLHRFPELDLIILMGTLALPWATPFIMKFMGASAMSMPSIAAAVQAAIPFVQFDLSSYGAQVFLSFLPVLPAMAVAVVVGLAWDWKRWLICAAIFHV
ncbi:MAG: TIGR03663 family protein, partial [Anaerolineae bacterium]|nr:TIGR03663 family protein [Anaerolineae bacterium]